MRRGGELLGVVAEAEFDALEQLSVGGIDEVLSHPPEGLFGGGPEPVHKGTDAGFAVLGGR